MWIDFENPMNMGVGMGITLKNGYGCEYSYASPMPIPTWGCFELSI